MEIDSKDYYNIVLSTKHNEAGAKLLAEITEKLAAQGHENSVEDMVEFSTSGYILDVRCLIGFALTNDEYEFGVGRMCHVIGHQVMPLIKTILINAELCEHPESAKITALSAAISNQN